MKKFLVYLAIILLISYLTPRALAKMLNTPYPMAAITSSSMWPTLKEGDLVLIRGIKGEGDIKAGDIVVYRNEKGFTIHRVVERQQDKVITKGDANSREDSPVEITSIIGRTLTLNNKPLHLPYLGRISMTFNR